MKKSINDMSSTECLDELVFKSFRSILGKARKKQLEADAAHREVMKALEDMCIDARAIVPAVNYCDAENLEDAISAYIKYGVFGVENIMRDIKNAYKVSETLD